MGTAAPSENRPVCEARGRLELSTVASLCVENNGIQHAFRESGVRVRGLNPGRSETASSLTEKADRLLWL